MSLFKQQSTAYTGIIIWLVVAIFFLYEYFLRAFVGAIAEPVITDLSLNAKGFTLLASSYTFAYGIMQIPVGVLTDKYDLKWLVSSAILVCVLSVFMFSISQVAAHAYFARFLMGLSSAFAFVSLLVVVINWFPQSSFGLYVGLSQLIGIIGPILAGIPLASLLEQTDNNWRLSLQYIAMFGLALALLSFLFVKNKPNRIGHKRLYSQNEFTVTKQLGQLFKNSQVWLIAFYTGFISIGLETLGVLLGVYYLEKLGFSHMQSASAMTMMWIGYAIGCPTLGAVSDKMGKRKPIMLISALASAAFSILLVLNIQVSIGCYAFLLFMIGFTTAGQSVGFAIISEHVPEHSRATALGFNNAMIGLFMVFAPPLIGYLIDLSALDNSSHFSAADLRFGLQILPLFYLVSAAFTFFFIKETYCQPKTTK